MHNQKNIIQINSKSSFLKNRKICIVSEFENDDSLQHLFRNIDQYFKSHGKKILKDDHSSTVIRVCLNKRDIVLRRDNFVNVKKFLRRAIRKSRSRKIWNNGRLLREYKLKTIRPIALVEDYFSLLRTGSYVICEYIDGTNLKAYFSDPDISGFSKKRIANALMKSIDYWHAIGITHGDPKASNIIVKGEDVYLVDVEDVRFPKTQWFKEHCMIRDKYILLHNWQRYPEQRELWNRRLTMDRRLKKRTFGKRLLKKFWKDEYAIFSSNFSKSIDLKFILKKSVSGDFFFRWLNMGTAKEIHIPASQNKKYTCIFTRRAFFLIRSIEGYFTKKRIPRKGVFSVTLALGICGFKLPEIIDGGVSSGCEYLVVGDHAGSSIHFVWQQIKDRLQEKISVLKILAEEVGRLHALGFVGVIASLDSIFIEKKARSFAVGFIPNSAMKYQPSKGCRLVGKEMACLETEFLSRLPVSEETIFWDVYKKMA